VRIPINFIHQRSKIATRHQRLIRLPFQRDQISQSILILRGWSASFLLSLDSRATNWRASSLLEISGCRNQDNVLLLPPGRGAGYEYLHSTGAVLGHRRLCGHERAVGVDSLCTKRRECAYCLATDRSALALAFTRS
jgi:hypothetical protein